MSLPVAGAGLEQRPAKSAKAGVTWDEVTIAEHDKERGTRTRISEPKTPFRPNKSGSGASVESVSDDEASHASSTPPHGSEGPHVIGAALQGRWGDLTEDHEAHDEWDAFASTASSPGSSLSGPGNGQAQYDADGDDSMSRNFVYDSGSESGTRPSSSGSESSRTFRRKHSAGRAHFAGGDSGIDTARSGVSFAPPTDETAAETEQHRKDFESRRKAHYSHEFDKAKTVDLKALLSGKAALADEEDEDEADASSSKRPALGGIGDSAFPAKPQATPVPAASPSWPFTAAAGRTPFHAAPSSPFGTGGGFSTAGRAFNPSAPAAATRQTSGEMQLE